MAELGLYLAAIVNPGILPGNWTPLVPDMEYYLFASIFAMLFIAISGKYPAGGTEVSAFLTRFSMGAALTWVAVTVLFYYSIHSTPLTGGTKIEYLLFTGFFIAPVEELLFRVALPPRWGWFVASSLAFAAFHIPIYLLESGATVDGFLGNLIQPAIMGVVLWFAYRWKGLPFSMGIHFAYDAFVYGELLGLPLAAAGLGLVPL